MSILQIKNEQWNKIAEFLQQQPKVYVGNFANRDGSYEKIVGEEGNAPGVL